MKLLMEVRAGVKNTAFRAALGVGPAALIAAPSHSLGYEQLRHVNWTAVSLSTRRWPAMVVPSLAKRVGVGAEKVSDAGGVPVSDVIEQAKKNHGAGFAAKLATLKSSPEFSRFLISQAGSVEAGGVEGLAAALTQEQVNAFVASIRGKSFEVVPGNGLLPVVTPPLPVPFVALLAR